MHYYLVYRPTRDRSVVISRHRRKRSADRALKETARLNHHIPKDHFEIV